MIDKLEDGALSVGVAVALGTLSAIAMGLRLAEWVRWQVNRG